MNNYNSCSWFIKTATKLIINTSNTQIELIPIIVITLQTDTNFIVIDTFRETVIFIIQSLVLSNLICLSIQ